ncbi:DUF6286 domain-containing protein [Arthrobacter cryoconiti]|uniref:DUF6286 domain-containing protein n=1 Tax=Arthrobacter cryoconiti TaxID=748907 RepID=A0ABV8QXM8_9MICC|nr:DUF6286 domain-containing protein [Arthrobacter cryoconiti]MCC9067680.1 DUF6286 domain-containing protein [Arthrobacter cryoconiti]
MSQSTLIRRLSRRETHSARSALSIVSGAVLLILILWLVVELVLSMTGNAPLTLSPAELAERTAALATDTLPAALWGAAAVLVLLGLVLVSAAILPGRKSRHVLANPRSAVVVDSQVLAGAISRIARNAAGLAPEQVTSSVGRKRVHVVLDPASGRAVDTEAVRAAVQKHTSGYELRRPLAVSVTNAQDTAVGA